MGRNWSAASLISQDTLPHFYQVPLHTPLLYTNHSIVTQALPVSLKNLRLRWGGRTVTQTVRFCLFNSAITLHPLIPQKNMPNLSNASKLTTGDCSGAAMRWGRKEHKGDAGQLLMKMI